MWGNDLGINAVSLLALGRNLEGGFRPVTLYAAAGPNPDIGLEDLLRLGQTDRGVWPLTLVSCNQYFKGRSQIGVLAIKKPA